MGYFACEKVPMESIYQGDIIKIIDDALNNFATDQSLIQELCHIINNLAYMASKEEFASLKSSTFAKVMTSNVNKLAKNSVAKHEVQLTLFGLKQNNQGAFKNAITWDFPIFLSGFDVDPYPNGVHDLPKEAKDILRAGSRVTLVLNEKDRDECLVRASQDLLLLQWQVGNSSSFQNMPIARIRRIAKGLKSDTLVKAHRKDWKVSENTTFVFTGPVTPDYPDGMELNMKAKTRKDRDTIVDWIIMWRDAATYSR